MVCLQHNRHWPCKEPPPGGRDHVWAYYTIWTGFAEREEEDRAPTREPVSW